MRDTVTFIGLFAITFACAFSMRSCTGAKPMGSDNDSPIIVTDPPDMIEVSRPTVPFLTKPFHEENGRFRIHARNFPIVGHRYRGTCVEGLDSAGKKSLVPLTKDKPWFVRFLAEGEREVFTVYDQRGDSKIDLDHHNATLKKKDDHTLTTGPTTTYTHITVTSTGPPAPLRPGTPKNIVIIHFCPNGNCKTSTENPCQQ